MQTEFLNLISQGGVVSMSVAAILLAMSVGSWMLMLIKSVQLRLLKRSNANFLAAFHPSEFDHDHLFTGLGVKPKASAMIVNEERIRAVLAALSNNRVKPLPSPYVRLVVYGLNAAEQYSQYHKAGHEPSRQRDEYIGQSLRRTLGNEALQLEIGLTLLASIGSIAPFVGLFGTVWGIYHALGAIAVGGQATVDKVAGPVGEALIMTAFGLAVAMPAVLAYNAFIRDNRLLMAELENFAHDLFTSLTLGTAQAEKPITRTTSSKASMAVVS